MKLYLLKRLWFVISHCPLIFLAQIIPALYVYTYAVTRSEEAGHGQDAIGSQGNKVVVGSLDEAAIISLLGPAYKLLHFLLPAVVARAGQANRINGNMGTACSKVEKTGEKLCAFLPWKAAGEAWEARSLAEEENLLFVLGQQLQGLSLGSQLF